MYLNFRKPVSKVGMLLPVSFDIDFKIYKIYFKINGFDFRINLPIIKFKGKIIIKGLAYPFIDIIIFLILLTYDRYSF